MKDQSRPPVLDDVVSENEVRFDADDRRFIQAVDVLVSVGIEADRAKNLTNVCLLDCLHAYEELNDNRKIAGDLNRTTADMARAGREAKRLLSVFDEVPDAGVELVDLANAIAEEDGADINFNDLRSLLANMHLIGEEQPYKTDMRRIRADSRAHAETAKYTQELWSGLGLPVSSTVYHAPKDSDQPKASDPPKASDQRPFARYLWLMMELLGGRVITSAQVKEAMRRGISGSK